MKNHTNKNGGIQLGRGHRAVILIASIITAIAVAVACALCFNVVEKPVSVDSVESGEVTTSTTYTNKTGNLTTPGAIAKGDILNYTTSGSILSVTLPMGTYRFDIYGAEGGGRRLSGNTYSGYGGYGGYSYGTYKITALSQTIYMAIGGYGKSATSGNAAGGYNGGGQGYASSSSEPGNGGGGATHIALRSGLLSALSSYKTDIIMVAGGGGGGGEDAGDWYGNGGGSSGVNGTSSNSAGHGTQTGAGTGGGFGYGGGTNKGDGGGGGGGWYGGGTISNASVGYDTQGGGGGSGYVNTSKLTGYATTTSTHTGNGSIKITVNEVNVPPVSLGRTVTSTASNYYRGTSRGIAIAANTLAADNDCANISGGKATNVYFTNGTSTNYDTLPASNAGLYLDLACTKSASTYLSWTWTTTTLTITEIKRIPRNGVDGATADRRLTLYTKIRDAYGSATTRGVAVISFYLTVNDYGITAKTPAATATTFNKGTYTYRYGNSTDTGTAGAQLNYLDTANATKIYNPNGTAKKTVFLPKPISPTDTTAYTIYASDLYTDSDTAYDKVAFKSVATTSYTPYYSITYNADSTYATGLYPSITVKATGVRPPSSTYVATTITAQTSETSSKVAIGSANTDIQLVFRIANTRPYFASSNVSGVNTGLTSEPYVEIPTGGYVDFSIKNLVYDVDDGASLTATFAQGTTNLIVPSREYIQVDTSNLVVPLKESVLDKDGNTRSSNYYGKTAVGTDSATTGMGTTATGFDTSAVALTGSSAASSACVTYSYVNSTTIRFSARAASTYMYSGEGRLGDFYVLVRIIDPSDTADAGLWYPIALKVNSATPVSTTPIANFSIGFDYTAGTAATLNGDGSDVTRNDPQSVVLSPVSYTSDGVLVAAGSTSEETVFAGNLSPFVVDPDTFVTGSGSDIKISEAVFLDTSSGSPFILQNTESFFSVGLRTIYVPSSLFDDHAKKLLAGVNGVSSVGNDLYELNGIEITAKRATNEEYFEFLVKVVDIHGARGTVNVLVKVENRAVSPRRLNVTGGTIDTRYFINPGDKGEYLVNQNIGAKAVNYTIERNDVIQITPYDFVYDFDVNDAIALNPSTTGYNTNPVNAGFVSAMNESVLKTYTVNRTSSPTTAVTSASVTAQTLSFTNIDNFRTNASQYSSYISVDVRDYSEVSSSRVNVPSITITGISRTTTAVVQLRFTVSDGYSNIECLITVTVLNSKPLLNTAENHPVTSSGDKRIVEPYTMAVTPTAAYPNTSYQFTATELAYDKDGDTPTFIPGTAKIVAKVGDEYYEYLTSDFKGGDGTNFAYRMSDYISAALSKNSMGEDVIVIRALSSTQLFPVPVYLQFEVQDGYRAQIQTAVLHVLLDVVNTAPTWVTEGLTQTSDESGVIDYHWMISYQTTAEKRQARYIVNSKELYDSSAITASSANKFYLFDDADAMQNVILDPEEWADPANSDQKQLMSTVSDSVNINSNSFATYRSSAVIYSSTYKNDTDSSKQFLTVEVLFFKKGADGNFTEMVAGDDRSKSQYWAIKITDSGSDTAAFSTRIAIAVKDNHDGADIYNAAKTSTTKGSSALKVLNFYYEYEMPNITAMHEYYRTDPNVEAKTLVDSSKTATQDTDYLVNLTGLSGISYAKLNMSDSLPSTQDGLADYTFSENFKYAYFAKTVAVGSGTDLTSEATYKHFPATAFYYAPISVSAASASNGIVVPMSYIAMPANGTESTENSAHVTFANASTTLRDGYLYDVGNAYRSWDENLVLDNLTLTDIKGGKWTGAAEIKTNPYIEIGYVSNANYLDSTYLNKVRFQLTASRSSNGQMGAIQSPTINWNDNGTSIFREDKYGFNIKKKAGGERSSGLLTLTLALKTTSGSATTDSKIQYISVDIDVSNSSPTVTYNNSTIGGYIDNLAVEMTASDVAGKTVALIDQNNSNENQLLGDYRLYYSDINDTTDTMKFLMSSAVGGLSTADKAHVKDVDSNNLNGSSTALNRYYDITTSGSSYTYYTYNAETGLLSSATSASLTAAQEASYVNTVPNPGYEKFFSVSPVDGISSTLQFTPVAKTQLNISATDLAKAETKAELFAKYHLEVDGNGKIYYPFRVLFYDEVDGSPFTDGKYASAIMRVYINNDPLSLNRTLFYDEKGNLKNYGSVNTDPNASNKTVACYTFSLSKNTNFFVDVTNLLVDNDIVLGNGSFITSDDQLVVYNTDASGNPTEEVNAEATYFSKITKDYLKMPLTNGKLNYSIVKSPISSGLPVTVLTPKEANLELSDTTMVFNATSAFRGTVDIMFTFSDSAVDSSNVSQSIIFSISYNNENPTPNASTFKGADIRTIEMVTGESFKVYAADRKEFTLAMGADGETVLNYGDVAGGFLYYDAVDRGYSKEATDAAALDNMFGINVANGYLGALIVGSDDAASTLRFSSLKFDNLNDGDMFDADLLKGSEFFTPELGGRTLPMCYEFKAIGVVNAGVTLTLIDAGGKTTDVRFNIIVRSTPPTPITDQATLDRTNATVLKYNSHDNVYEIGNGTNAADKFKVGQSVTIQLRNFINDIDEGDLAGLTVYQNTDRSYFRITNPLNISAIAVDTTFINADEAITITATDLITQNNQYSEVTFRVADVHGEVSNNITIRVYIEPQEIEAVATVAKPYSTVIKSYAEYADGYEPFTLRAVSSDRATAALFYDSDADAYSSSYDVEIYALLNKTTENGSDRFISMRVDDFIAITDTVERENHLLVKLISGSNTPSRSEIASYVGNYFTITVSQDGKTLTFIPNSATIAASGTSLDSISLYITVSKRSFNENGSVSTPSSTANAVMNASVANSALMATANSSFNMGYPRIKVEGADGDSEEETYRYRDEEFLTFTGSAGDSLTWDIYNSQDHEYGLFYDYDMINVDGTSSVAGRESIQLVPRHFEINPERPEAITSSTPILTINVDDNTHKVTITINRKPFTGQPPKDGYSDDENYKYSNVQVVLYAADTMMTRAGTSDKTKLVKTTITVRIENDDPQIKSVEDFTTNETRPNYSIRYSDVDGYVLDETLERGASLRLNIKDIIKDADIDMDEYVLVYSGGDNSLMGNDGVLYGSTTVGGVNDAIGRIKSGSETLFEVRLTTANNSYSVSTLSAITFTCVSTARGAVGTCQLQFRDSMQSSRTRVLNINLTVDNIAPYVKPNVSTTVTVMGVGKDATEDDVSSGIANFSILDFIADDNGDAYNAAEAKVTSPDMTHTYTYIDEIVVYTTDDGDPSLRPSIYGPNKDGDGSEDAEPAVNVCYVDWASADENHQTFAVTPMAGVYGRQKVALRISDSGYADGSMQGVLDGKTYTLMIDIIIANPLEDVAEVLDTQSIAYGITRTIDINALLGEQNAQGYTINSIVEIDTNNLEIYAPGETAGARTSALTSAPSSDNWRIYAKTEDSSANLKITFAAGNVTVERTLPIRVTVNTAPDYKNGKLSYEYTVSKLDDQQNRTIKIYPEMWFDDADAEDIMAFVDPITSSQSVKVSAMYDYDDIANGGRAFILLTFNRRGESEITLNVTDLSGRLYSRTVTVNCTDAPEMSWWENVVSLIEANWMWFWIIVGCVLLFIILLIILIVVICKKRRMRREIEALLESETELEEEMMRLNASAAQYQSFGYLPPTQATMSDTGFMIGGGQSAPMQNSLQLNAGSGIPSQSAQINSVPGSGATTVPGNGARPVNSMPGNMNGNRQGMRPNMSMPGNPPPRPQQPQQPMQTPPPVNNDGFDPNDF